MRPILARMAFVAVAVVGLVACSSERRSDGSTREERDAYASALAANWGSDGASGFVLIGRRAECVAERWIDVIGVARLRDAGFEPADLDPREGGAFEPRAHDLTAEQASTMVDAFDECGADLVDLFVSARAEGLDSAARECLRDELTPELAEAVIEASLHLDETPADVEGQLNELSRTCGSA